MATQIFVNLPVSDLNRSIDFFTKLGFRFDPGFTDEKATCMVIGEDIFVMLLVKEFFQSFTKKQVADASKTTEVIVAISADKKKVVDDICDRAILAGASETRPAMDKGFMYYRSFQDLDGHLWEVIHMDLNTVYE